MTGSDLLAALGDQPVLRVVHRNGRRYDVERDVILANAKDERPYIYGWPVLPKWHRQHGRAQHFFAENVAPEQTEAKA
jgi:hypothetical protein